MATKNRIIDVRYRQGELFQGAVLTQDDPRYGTIVETSKGIWSVTETDQFGWMYRGHIVKDDWKCDVERGAEHEASTVTWGRLSGIVDISDLVRGPFFVYPIRGDYNAMGLTLVNKARGTSANWALVKTERDADGDVTRWIFKPTAGAVVKHPRLRGMELVVVND